MYVCVHIGCCENERLNHCEKKIAKTDEVKEGNARMKYEKNRSRKSLYILHVSVSYHLPGPLLLLPDVVSIIYPASIGQYWNRLSALLPYWQQDNGPSINNGSEKEETAMCCCAD